MKLKILDKKILNYKFDKDDKRNPKVTELCQFYVDDFFNYRPKKRGLVFIGGEKTGKTFYAMCIVNALLLRSNGIFLCDIMNIIKQIKNSPEDKKRIFNQINFVDLVVIDNFGNSEGDLFVTEELVEILRQRYFSDKALIITTRIPLSKIKAEQNLRTSEIYNMISSMCYPIEL